MMFVKIFAVLYELQLNHLKVRRETIRSRYKKAFGDYYRLYDAYVVVSEEYDKMPTCVFGDREQADIDAAGGRQSKAYAKMQKREVAMAKVDRAVSSAKARAARYPVIPQTAPAPPRGAVIASGVALATLH